MAKVVNAFFCTKEQKNYKVGDEYTGKRKDLVPLYVEGKKSTPKKENKKEPKAKLEKK